MIWFILFIIFTLVTVGYALARKRIDKMPEDFYGNKTTLPKFGVYIAAGLAFAALFMATTYVQDPGEAKVLKSWTGEIVGQDTDEGFGVKLPWVDAVDYDIRNNQAAYVGNGTDDFNGKKPDGPQITVQDANGVSSDVDVIVRYSIIPSEVTDVYIDYGVQENFRKRLIDNDIRSVVRVAPNKYGTIDMLTKRSEMENQIFDDLKARWQKQGVQVESVALQEIRPPADVKQSYSDAQNARTQIVKAQAELEAAQISAQQKVVQAEAEAKANNTLAASLTEPILRQRYLDTLGKLAAEGNVFMTTPDGGAVPTIPVK